MKLYKIALKAIKCAFEEHQTQFFIAKEAQDVLFNQKCDAGITTAYPDLPDFFTINEVINSAAVYYDTFTFLDKNSMSESFSASDIFKIKKQLLKLCTSNLMDSYYVTIDTRNQSYYYAKEQNKECTIPDAISTPLMSSAFDDAQFIYENFFV